MPQIHIFSTSESPRLHYVLSTIIDRKKDLTYAIYTDKDHFLRLNGLKINYSDIDFDLDAAYIPAHSYITNCLQIKDYTDQLNVLTQKELNVSNNRVYHVDIFAAIFFHLSRHEEYTKEPTVRDSHDRFLSSASILSKQDALEFPLVDVIIDGLFGILVNQRNDVFQDNNVFRWSLGIDIDNWYKYKHKSIFKTFFGSLNYFLKGKIQEGVYRLQVVLGIKKDPYDTYEYLLGLGIPKEQLMVFILSGGKTTYDKNQSIALKPIQNLLSRLKKYVTLGLHPSYSTSSSFQQLQFEKSHLEQAIGNSIDRSRQHYLRLQFPETYEHLIKLGITTDYSLVYAEAPGFRAGTCHPFYWYNLNTESQTQLRLIPPFCMDRSYVTYLKLDPKAALQHFRSLLAQIVKHRGHAHVIWHNSSFDVHSEWKPWLTMLDQVLEELRSAQAK